MYTDLSLDERDDNPILLRMVHVDLEPSDNPSTNQVLPRPCYPTYHSTVLCPPNEHFATSLDHRKELIQSEILKRVRSSFIDLQYTRSTESDCPPPTVVICLKDAICELAILQISRFRDFALVLYSAYAQFQSHISTRSRMHVSIEQRGSSVVCG